MVAIGYYDIQRGALNPTCFHYCYRCGEKILSAREDSEDDDSA